MDLEFDIVIAYKPLELKEFRDVKIPKCLRYNEMFDIEERGNINSGKKGEIPMYFFKADASKSYQETDEYELWLELIRRQEKQDKKTMSKNRGRGFRIAVPPCYPFVSP